jgi:MFS family permease
LLRQSFFGSLYLQGTLGYSALRTGLAVLPLTLVALVSSSLAGRLIDRHGIGAVLSGSLVSMSAAFGLLARLEATGRYLVDVLPAFLLFGIGVGAGFVAVTIAATDNVPSGDQGAASGLINTSNQLGFALGIAVLVAVSSTRTKRLGGENAADAAVAGYRAAWAVAAGLAAATAIAAFVALRRADQQHNPSRRPPGTLERTNAT